MKKKNTRVFVLIGPFNPFILSEESHIRYRAAIGTVELWLHENGVDHHSASDLPSEYYADASHPLAAGYARIAEELNGTASFQKWLALSR